MAIGDVIKRNRKIIGITQEEMAKCLGVTAPAVNKWEKGTTFPDVTLLAPIARLLKITTDELLSFHEELSDVEIHQYLLQLQTELMHSDFHELFLSAKKKIETYPNCEKLIWQTAMILHAKLMTIELPDKRGYVEVIFDWFEQCLQSDDEQIRKAAAESLFYGYFNKGNYQKSRQYLDYLSLDDSGRKRKEALLDSKTGKRENAYRMHEEIIFSSYQSLQMALNDLRILYMEDDEHAMVKKLAKVSSGAAKIFEMGKYDEVSVDLNVACWEKDEEGTIEILQSIFDNIDTIGSLRNSLIYQHMKLKAVPAGFTDYLRGELLKSLDSETFDFMNGNVKWEKWKNDIIP